MTISSIRIGALVRFLGQIGDSPFQVIGSVYDILPGNRFIIRGQFGEEIEATADQLTRVPNKRKN